MVGLPTPGALARQQKLLPADHHGVLSPLLDAVAAGHASTLRHLRSPTAAKVDSRCLCQPMRVRRGQTDTHRQPARSLFCRHHHLFLRILAQLGCGQLERRKAKGFSVSGAH